MELVEVVLDQREGNSLVLAIMEVLICRSRWQKERLEEEGVRHPTPRTLVELEQRMTTRMLFQSSLWTFLRLERCQAGEGMTSDPLAVDLLPTWKLPVDVTM